MMAMQPEAYTIEQFCKAHGFSKAHYFNIARAGLGPRIMRVGSRVLISREAAADWRKARETAATEAA
jgi:hypothetical protein